MPDQTGKNEKATAGNGGFSKTGSDRETNQDGELNNAILNPAGIAVQQGNRMMGAKRLVRLPAAAFRRGRCRH